MNDIISKYLGKQKVWVEYPKITDFDPDIIVAIPCHNEPDIKTSIQSLFDNHCKELKVEIVIVLNHSESCSEDIKAQNLISLEQIQSFINVEDNYKITPIEAYDLPKKKAGVGLARKIGMDYACKVFSQSEKNGIITCYDADSLCANNYIEEVYKIFINNPKIDGITIDYEHPKSGNEFSKEIYQAIAQYEKHLYYYIDIQKSLNLPFAYHTVGSSMAVKANSYAKLGGMNLRQAGEDFYFMQKFIENGKVAELKTTKVFPSPRISDRVPFGTGKAVGDMMGNNGDIVYYTYHPKSFYALKPFLENLKNLYPDSNNDKSSIEALDLHEGLLAYFKHINIDKILDDCINNSSSYPAFYKRFFRHFNAFQLMKYLHYMRDHHYENIPIDEAVEMF